MEQWKRLALLLCVYGVIKELRPLEPFITRFFTTPPMNFTHDEINLQIYPIAVYSNMISLVIIFLITDLVRYKPIIVLNSLAGVSLYIVLIRFRTVLAMQVVEVFYGIYIACEVAYYTYIYAAIDKLHYQEVTGYTRAAYLFGKGLSGIASQILLLCGLQLMSLAYISLAILFLSLFWAISLPSVTTSIYFNRTPDAESTTAQIERSEAPKNNKIKEGFKLLYFDFIAACKQVNIRKYVFWWAACNGGYLQVLQFVQVLWEEITSSTGKGDLMMNGAVEAVCTFMGAIGAFSFGRWKADWVTYGDLSLSLGALSLGGILILMAMTKSLIVAYITYVCFSVVYNAVVTIAKSQIASSIKPDSTGLIFGITIFLALIFQTVITLIFVQHLKFSAKLQFSLYGYYYVAIGAAFGLKWLYITFCAVNSTQIRVQHEEKATDSKDYGT